MPNINEIREGAVILGELAETSLGKTTLKAAAKFGAEALDLFQETSTTKIPFKLPEGEIVDLSPRGFEAIFGVKYAPKLIIDKEYPSLIIPERERSNWPLPLESDRPDFERTYAREIRNSPSAKIQFSSDRDKREWLYASQIDRSHTENMYIGRVDDIVGYGAFAGKVITPGKMLGEYTGIVRGAQADDARNEFLFDYGKALRIDARDTGNITRFINHSEAAPNAREVHVIVDDVEHVILAAIKPIKKDQQILFDYGARYWAREPLAPRKLGND